MKKELLFAFAAFFYMSLSAITGVNAIEEKQKIITISKDSLDITGDGKKDTVYIKGKPYEKGTQFLKEIYMKINASNGKTYKIDFEGGYNPTVQFKDLNHDQIKDILIAIETGGSGGLSNYYLYTLKDFTLTNLSVPEPLNIEAQFQDQYKALLTITNTGQSYTIDLNSRAQDYDRIGLYHDGKLNEPRELMVLPYGLLQPVPLKDGQYGLKGVQRISGASNADSIAFVDSIWLYKDGKWVLEDTKVNIIEQRSKK